MKKWTSKALQETLPEALEDTRAIFMLLVQVWIQLLRGKFRKDEVLKYAAEIGVQSLPILALCTVFSGIVVTDEMAWHMDKALHSLSMMPGFSGQFVFREIGVVIPALLIVSKVGAAMTAEIGTMKTTEQIDALRLLQIDPVDYLVCPRWIASVLSMSALVIICSGITLIGAMGVAAIKHSFSVLEYLNGVRTFLTQKDLLCMVVKSLAFGATIPIISCAYGFRCKEGAEGVGLATTRSVVTGTLAVIGIDFVLTYVFTQLI